MRSLRLMLCLAVGWSFFIASGSLQAEDVKEPRKPNIVFFLADDK